MTSIPRGRNERRVALKMERATMERRPCGECTACCTTHEVPTLSKTEWVRCEHLRTRTEDSVAGCTIYAKRPAECAKWNCMWRKGFGQPHDRPDISGVVFSVNADPQVITAHECSDGAFDRPEPNRLIAELHRDGFIVVMKRFGEEPKVLGDL